MPIYRVWYRNNEEPVQIVAASRLNDDEILDRLLAQERIAAAGTGADGATVQERIASNKLGLVKYTEDESEMITLG
jgi:hypothetical protein